MRSSSPAQAESPNKGARTVVMSSLKNDLYDHIPLARAMEVEVDSISDMSITLSAPIAPND